VSAFFGSSAFFFGSGTAAAAAAGATASPFSDFCFLASFFFWFLLRLAVESSAPAGASSSAAARFFDLQVVNGNAFDEFSSQWGRSKARRENTVPGRQDHARLGLLLDLLNPGSGLLHLLVVHVDQARDVFVAVLRVKVVRVVLLVRRGGLVKVLLANVVADQVDSAMVGEQEIE
jgi:hypothetical protein